MVLVSCEVVDKSEKVKGKILTIIFILIKEKVAGNKSSIARIAKFVQADASGQSYKHFRLVNCNSRVENGVFYERKMFIRLATGIGVHNVPSRA